MTRWHYRERKNARGLEQWPEMNERLQLDMMIVYVASPWLSCPHSHFDRGWCIHVGAEELAETLRCLGLEFLGCRLVASSFAHQARSLCRVGHWPQPKTHPHCFSPSFQSTQGIMRHVFANYIDRFWSWCCFKKICMFLDLVGHGDTHCWGKPWWS